MAKNYFLNSLDECDREFESYAELMEHLYKEHRAVLIALVISSEGLYQVVGDSA